jgi:hypothetical protein
MGSLSIMQTTTFSGIYDLHGSTGCAAELWLTEEGWSGDRSRLGVQHRDSSQSQRS